MTQKKFDKLASLSKLVLCCTFLSLIKRNLEHDKWKQKTNAAWRCKGNGVIITASHTERPNIFKTEVKFLKAEVQYPLCSFFLHFFFIILYRFYLWSDSQTFYKIFRLYVYLKLPTWIYWILTVAVWVNWEGQTWLVRRLRHSKVAL